MRWWGYFEGSHSSRFSRDSTWVFETSGPVSRNICVRKPDVPGLYKHDISDNAYEHFEFPTVRENIYRNTAYGTSHKEEGKREGEEDMQVRDCRVRIETLKGEERLCKGSGMICVILGRVLALVFSIALII